MIWLHTQFFNLLKYIACTCIHVVKQDAWITIFPAVLIGSLNIWVMSKLSNRHPGLTIIQYSSQIIGKWPGKYRFPHENSFYHCQFNVGTILLFWGGFFLI
ncbi:GerAB/ArcD/ProY family transporter [Paenibacillus sp. LMG 31458]|uniref:GerAB/ArcD/ProY family transporter n=1 Tax=Paenibacillus phytorum TaxID=2654977 RepID=A0ABX1Y6B9_9BACL|nr:GerAB/ArcD/ProY family transporter [Paenibacillus phytorum]